MQSALTGVTGLTGLRGENDSLRARLAATELELAALKERGRATARLEEMLDFRERSRFQLVAARIVAHEAGGSGHELKIDRGSWTVCRRTWRSSLRTDSSERFPPWIPAPRSCGR